jgi:hypothetical protein
MERVEGKKKGRSEEVYAGTGVQQGSLLGRILFVEEYFKII